MGGRTQDLHSQGHLLQHAALSAWLTACAAFGMRTVAPQLAEYKPWTYAGQVKKDLKILDLARKAIDLKKEKSRLSTIYITRMHRPRSHQ